jgi:membrane protein DedA with SNARE-associated domain
MYNLEQILLNFSEFHRFLTYAAIFLGMFIEGEIILVLSGILIKSGQIYFLETFAIAFMGAVMHDFGFWLVGKKLLKTDRKKFLFFNLEKIKAFLDKFNNFNAVYVFISKFGWSINRVVLISSGYLKVSVQKLIKYSLLANLFWVAIFISIGYTFAGTTEILKKDVKLFSILVTVFIIAIIVIENLIQKFIKKQAIK